ncbi:uncharacterized protein PF3D7_1120000-like [Dysidea avara]|uniref:uncharacterized protein PF3D7_1120000-like n=1 Tax=Dysidea avara TaxID=196820 RepID=UPI00332DE687
MTVKQDKEKSKFDIVKNVRRKEEELKLLLEKAIEDRKIELSNKMNQMGLAQIKEIEKKYECIIADKATKHQQDIEKLFKKFESSSRKEEEFTKVAMLVKDAEMEIEQLKLEKADIINQKGKTQVNTQEVVDELNEYKQKFEAEVDKVKRRYCNTISELINEATQLKYVIKNMTCVHCATLCNIVLI